MNEQPLNLIIIHLTTILDKPWIMCSPSSCGITQRSTRRCQSNKHDQTRGLRSAERGNGTSTFGSLTIWLTSQVVMFSVASLNHPFPTHEKNISKVSQIQWWMGKLSPNLGTKFETAWDVLLVAMIFSRKPSPCEGTINKGPIHTE